MIKKISKEQFDKCATQLKMEQKMLAIAYRVLVLGKRQTEVVISSSPSRAHISQAIAQVWETFEKIIIPVCLAFKTSGLRRQKVG